MRGQMGKKTTAPAALPDNRRFFVKGACEEGKETWNETPVQDLVPDQVIAVVDESEWSPKDVILWVVEGVPYIGKAGLWTVQVSPYNPVVDKG